PAPPQELEAAPDLLRLPAGSPRRGSPVEPVRAGVEYAALLARVLRGVGDEQRSVVGREAAEEASGPLAAVGRVSRPREGAFERAGERRLRDPALPGCEQPIRVVRVEGDEAAVGAEDEAPGLAALRQPEAVVLEAAAEDRRRERALRDVVHLRRAD